MFYIVGEFISNAAGTHLDSDLTCKEIYVFFLVVYILFANQLSFCILSFLFYVFERVAH